LPVASSPSLLFRVENFFYPCLLIRVNWQLDELENPRSGLLVTWQPSSNKIHATGLGRTIKHLIVIIGKFNRYQSSYGAEFSTADKIVVKCLIHRKDQMFRTHPICHEKLRQSCMCYASLDRQKHCFSSFFKFDQALNANYSFLFQKHLSDKFHDESNANDFSRMHELYLS